MPLAFRAGGTSRTPGRLGDNLPLETEPAASTSSGKVFSRDTDPMQQANPPVDPQQAQAAEAAQQSKTQQAASDQPAGAHQDLIPEPDPAAELAEAQQTIATLNDQILRAHAEVENIRRRSAEEAAKARKFAVEGFAEALLPVADSLEAALADGSGDIAVLKQGVELTLSQLRSAFERNQLRAIAPQPGDRFDPALHQAISMQPSNLPANTVVSVLQKGYQIAERTLRPALVTVSQGQSAAG